MIKRKILEEKKANSGHHRYGEEYSAEYLLYSLTIHRRIMYLPKIPNDTFLRTPTPPLQGTASVQAWTSTRSRPIGNIDTLI